MVNTVLRGQIGTALLGLESLSVPEEEEFQLWAREQPWFRAHRNQFGSEPDLTKPGTDWRAAWRKQVAAAKAEKAPDPFRSDIGRTYSLNLLRSEIPRDEGKVPTPYLDDGPTVGFGHNLGTVPFTPSQIDLLGDSYDPAERDLIKRFKKPLTDQQMYQILDDDIANSEAALDRNLPRWRTLSDARQRALMNMTFNMGWGGVSQFKRMLAAIDQGDYATAAAEMRHSKWATQVGDRARRLAQMMEAGD